MIKIVKFLDIVNRTTEKLNKKAQNPFTKNDFKYNPFKGALNQTYVWIENDNKTEG